MNNKLEALNEKMKKDDKYKPLFSFIEKLYAGELASYELANYYKEMDFSDNKDGSLIQREYKLPNVYDCEVLCWFSPIEIWLAVRDYVIAKDGNYIDDYSYGCSNTSGFEFVTLTGTDGVRDYSKSKGEIIL
jgi:hypothetical protein